MKCFLHSRTLLGTARGVSTGCEGRGGDAEDDEGRAEFAGLPRQLCGVGNTGSFVQRRERLGAVVLQRQQVMSSDVCGELQVMSSDVCGELFRDNLNDADGRQCFGMR